MIFFGIICKVNDEITDKTVIVNEEIKELFYTLTSCLLGGISLHDLNFSIFMYLPHLALNLADPNAFAHARDKAFLYAFPILCMFSLGSYKEFTSIDILTLLIFTVYFFCEGYIVKE